MNIMCKERKIKRVKMSGKEVTKKYFIQSFSYLSDLPDFTMLFNYYKWVYSTQEKKYKLIVMPISFNKRNKLFVVGTQTDEKEFTNKKKAIDYFYDIIKREWENIPDDVRSEL